MTQYKVPNPNIFGQLKENFGFQIAALLRMLWEKGCIQLVK